MGGDRLLVDAVSEQFPESGEAASLIAEGVVLVDGFPVLSPRARVRSGSAVQLRQEPTLRGSVKLMAALTAFPVDVRDRVCLDVGAAAGGFTVVLLGAGARRVYAVDAGHGQLIGRLRQDPRVVNLEATNLAELGRASIPDRVGLVTIDVSYLSLSAAVAQLPVTQLAATAELIGLVKPMFELRRPTAPTDRASLDEAASLASSGIEAAGWEVRGLIDSPVTGARGAPEMLLWAVRS